MQKTVLTPRNKHHDVTLSHTLNSTLKKQKSPDFIELIDRLVGGNVVNEIFDVSSATRTRMEKDGRLSPPDVRGGNGHGNKWLLSTVLRDRDRMCGKEVV